MIDDGLTPRKRASIVADFFRRYGDPLQAADFTKSVFEEALLPGRPNPVGAVSEPVPVLRFFAPGGEERWVVPDVFRKYVSPPTERTSV